VPVDPHIAALLTMLAETGLPPMHEGTPEAARTQYLTLSAARSSELVVPVGAVEETTVPGAEGDLRARVYRPEGEGPFPTVAFFHGGGWVIGDLDTHDRSVREICRGSRAVVVAVDYRLAPEHPSPAAAEDAVAAARWIAAHRGELVRLAPRRGRGLRRGAARRGGGGAGPPVRRADPRLLRHGCGVPGGAGRGRRDLRGLRGAAAPLSRGTRYARPRAAADVTPGRSART
jgi:hypothetical protein